MGNTTTSLSSKVKMPLPNTFNGDKRKFMDWFRHIEIYSAFKDEATDKQKVLVTCQLMNEGPAGTWSATYCARLIASANARSKHAPSMYSWKDFVQALKEAYTPINITGDAQARLRTLKQGTTLTDQFLIMFTQIMSDTGYSLEVSKDTTEADHLIDLLHTNMNSRIVHTAEDTHQLHKSRDFDAYVKALKDVGKALESRNGGRVPTIAAYSSSSSSAQPPIPRYTPARQQTAVPLTAPTVATDHKDATGVTYGGQGQPMDLSQSKTSKNDCCYNCCGTGHYSRDCPEPRVPQAQWVRNMYEDLNEEEKLEVTAKKDF
ncbi:hypothetical protein BDN67DRAFT_985623 [Paxillus ammoniavirescens]|nr:hypothetical protein BDN67DRAFT_985623 [Paxillus ammoniavirescens]